MWNTEYVWSELLKFRKIDFKKYIIRENEYIFILHFYHP